MASDFVRNWVDCLLFPATPVGTHFGHAFYHFLLFIMHLFLHVFMKESIRLEWLLMEFSFVLGVWDWGFIFAVFLLGLSWVKLV